MTREISLGGFEVLFGFAMDAFDNMGIVSKG